MNVSTRYIATETVQLLCGVPEAIEPLAAFARQLDGVAIVKQRTTGIAILEAHPPLWSRGYVRESIQQTPHTAPMSHV
jgi:hypothetical protein